MHLPKPRLEAGMLRNPVARYAVAAVAVVLALVLRALLAPLTGAHSPFVFLFAATLLTGLVAGSGPALASVLVSVPIAAYVFMQRTGHPFSEALARSILYIVDGVIVVYIASRLQRNRRKLESTNWQLQLSEAECAIAYQRTRETIELAPEAYFLADMDARLTDVNQAACKLLGYERDALVGKLVHDLLPASDLPRLEAVKAELLVPGTVSKREWTLRRADGSLVPVEASSNIISDGRWQAFVRDISEARRVADEREEIVARERVALEQTESINAQLRESEERFRLTIDEAPIGMALVALDGRFARVNRTLCEVSGYSVEELLTMTLRSITHPDDLGTVGELADQLMSGEIQRYQAEKRCIRKDHEVVDVMISGALLRTSDGTPRYFIVQMEDITQRKRAEDGLQRAVAARDEVLGIVAHDLRNPLATIVMQLSAMSRDSEPERRDQKPFAVIARAADRMTHLIRDLLDVAALEAGQLKLECERLPAADVAREAVASQAALAEESQLQLRVDIAPDAEFVWADHNRLLQVFENLIGNAIKFTEAGGCITVCAKPADGATQFSVSDTGGGIAPELLPRLFERFWQAATRARRLGAGLGLPITKGIIDAHGGKIWAESRLGSGTTFFFTIPTRAPEAALQHDKAA